MIWTYSVVIFLSSFRCLCVRMCVRAEISVRTHTVQLLVRACVRECVSQREGGRGGFRKVRGRVCDDVFLSENRRNRGASSSSGGSQVRMQEGTILGGGSAPGLFWVELAAADVEDRDQVALGSGEWRRTEADVEDLWRLDCVETGDWGMGRGSQAYPYLSGAGAGAKAENGPTYYACTDDGDGEGPPCPPFPDDDRLTNAPHAPAAAAPGAHDVCAPPAWFLAYLERHGRPPPIDFVPPTAVSSSLPPDFLPMPPHLAPPVGHPPGHLAPPPHLVSRYHPHHHPGHPHPPPFHPPPHHPPPFHQLSHPYSSPV